MILKVCGMRDPQNIRDLLTLPIDWMGLIFYQKSARHVPDSASEEILEATKGKVHRVGVFVNENIDIVMQKAARFQLDYVQLHGKESPDYCYDVLAKSAKTFGCSDNLKVIKAFSVDEQFDFSITKGYTPYVEYFIFDTKGKQPGGNGVPFNWQLLEQYEQDIPFLLSGGLDEFSAAAIQQVQHSQLAGVDVNSRFEIRPAVKDIARVQRFIHRLQQIAPVGD